MLRCSILTLAVLLALTGCRAEDDVDRTEDGWLVRGSEVVRDTTERTVRLGDRPLTIDIANGSVTLVGTDEAEARLRFERVARAGSAADAQRRLQRVEIEEIGDVDHYEFRIPGDRNRATEAHVFATIPRASRVVVRTHRGDVRLSELFGEVDVRVRTGNVEAAGLAGERVLIRNERGHQRIGFRTIRERADIRLTATNGNLELTLPPDGSAQITAETGVGSVAIEGLELSRERFEERLADTRYRGRLGDGRARILAETDVGDIRFIGSESIRLEGLETHEPEVGAPADERSEMDL